jgi:aryl-alcohol dehydrogenase-like predicted oxidoreductase
MSKISSNKLILGTVQMGLNYGVNNSSGQVSLKDSFKILNYAFENGITTLDSAEAYGNAHEVIGKFHQENPNRKFKIITKLPKDINKQISKKVDTYLIDLNIDQIEVLMFHSYESYTNNIERFDLLKQLKINNKIKSIGVSVYTNDEIEKVLINDDVDVIQVPFNLLDNANLRESILIKAKSKGKKIHSRSALLQGLFFKKIDNNNTVQSLKNELIKISDISKNSNIPISDLAISYCLNQKYIDKTLIGVDSLSQLKENFKSLNNILNTEVTNEINSIKVKNYNLLNPSLWK